MVRAHLPSSSLVVIASFSAAAVRALMAPGFLWSIFPRTIPPQTGIWASQQFLDRRTQPFLFLTQRVLSQLLQFIHLLFQQLQCHPFSGLTGLESIQLICVSANGQNKHNHNPFHAYSTVGCPFKCIPKNW